MQDKQIAGTTKGTTVSKKNRTSLMAFACAIVMAFLLCACGGDNANQSGATAQESTAAEQGEAATDESSSATDDAATSDETADDSAAATENDAAAKEGSSAKNDSTKSSKEDKAKAKAKKAREKLVKKLNASIEGVAANTSMPIYVSVIDLPTGAVAGYQSDTRIMSASMIKMLIAHTFLEQVKAGAFSLDDTYTLKASDIVGGTGTLGGLGAGAEVTYREILKRMINVSDNTGTNILIDAVGMDAINEDAKRLKLKETELNRHMMDYDAIAAGHDNYTCASDMAKLMRMVFRATFVDADSSALMLEALREQEDWCGIKNGLPEGTSFAHKTGTHTLVRHDGGIVEGDHPFVIVVLCGGDDTYYEQGALEAMANVASAVYSDLVG